MVKGIKISEWFILDPSFKGLMFSRMAQCTRVPDFVFISPEIENPSRPILASSKCILLLFRRYLLDQKESIGHSIQAKPRLQCLSRQFYMYIVCSI
jgi:hypothetical protein